MLCTTLGMPARALRSTAALRAASAPRSAALRCAASLLPPSRAGARRGVAAKAEPALLVAADGGPGSLPLTVTGLLSLLAAARLAFTGGGPAAAAEPAAAPPPPPPPPPKPENAVLVFGATGRLGRAVVAALLAEGRFVVAAVRSASASKAATMLPTSHPRLLVRTGVDTTDAATLGDSLFEGVTQAVVATAGLFGPLPGGGMGFVDGYTSERVDRDGVANVAAACAARLAPAAPPSFAPVCAFDGAAELGRWGPKDDSIMGGSSASGWSLVEGGDAQGPGAGPHGRWSGSAPLCCGGLEDWGSPSTHTLTLLPPTPSASQRWCCPAAGSAAPVWTACGWTRRLRTGWPSRCAPPFRPSA